MKIATKRLKVILISLACIFCLCIIGIFSLNKGGKTFAEEENIVNLTFHNMQYQNNTFNANKYWTSLCFLNADDKTKNGVSTGNAEGIDFSNIISKTTYYGSDNTFSYNVAYVYGWPVDTKSDTFRFIYLTTTNNPSEGDRVVIEKGAWFKTGGLINDKYVLAENVELLFSNSVWKYIVELAFVNEGTGIIWNGSNMGGVDINGIHPDGNPPEVGTCSLINVVNNGLLPTKQDLNLVTTSLGETVYLDGVPLKDVDGAFVCTVYGYVFIYIKAEDGIVCFKKGTDFNGYRLDKDYYYHLKKGINKSSLARKISFDSNGGKEVGEVYVNNGGIISSLPTATMGDSSSELNFDYWYLDDENIPFDFSTQITSDITLKAKWTTETMEVKDVEITFVSIQSSYNNNNGYTGLSFDKGVSSGGPVGLDVSNLIENTIYSGSNNSFTFYSAYQVWNQMDQIGGIWSLIYLYTTNSPVEGDKITIKAGAYFTTGGGIKERYVIKEDFSLIFSGNVWGTISTFIVKGITWNGADMSGKNGQQLNVWGIDNNGADAALPNVGTCALIDVEEDFSISPTLVTNYSGITHNGVDLKEIPGSVVAEWFGYLFIYVPYRSGLIKIAEGGNIGIRYADKDYYFILNEFSNRATWTIAIEPQLIDGEWIDLYGKRRVKFSSVNVYWNNVRNLNDIGEVVTNLTLNFDYLDEDKPEDPNEYLWLGEAMNSNPSSASKTITLNGKPLSEIDGAYVNYSQGYFYMFIVIPERELMPTEEYPHPKLVIKENTVFEDSVIPEVKLTLLGNSWVKGDYDVYENLPNEGYYTVTDLFGGNYLKVGVGESSASIIDSEVTDFRFVFSPDEQINYLSLYLCATIDKSWDGFRFEFTYDYVYMGYVVNVYDASLLSTEEMQEGLSGHKLLGTIPISINKDEYSKFVIRITKEEKYNILVIEDDSFMGEIKDITPRGDDIGNGLLIYSPINQWIFRDYKEGDINAPSIVLDSREIYFLNEGDSLPEIEYSVYDRTDYSEDISVERFLDDNALEDGKVLAGEWDYIIRATDKNNNITEKIIKLYVSGKQVFVVKFDGKNPVDYAVGSLINKPSTNPQKESTKKVYYEFDGWFNGDHRWDFENDTVTSDVNLVSKYIEKDVLYKVTFKGVGDSDVVIYGKYGSQIDLAFLNKEGYTIKLFVDGSEIDSVIVTKDVEINVSYNKNEVKKKKGCKSIFELESVLLLTIIITIVVIKRRGGSGYEEKN